MLKKIVYVSLLLLLFSNCRSKNNRTDISRERKMLADSLEHLLKSNLVDKWYPAAIDTLHGGYLSSFDATFKPQGKQEKMIVSQGRHLWNTSRAALHWPAEIKYKSYAQHGFEFLRDKMWDSKYGGFFQLVDRAGNPIGDSIKTAYGNSFGLFSIATYYRMSKDTAALSLTRKCFMWLEVHSHDSIHKGYYQHLTRQGEKIMRPASTPSTSDLGYKDQNSSIHLLEALTSCYEAWPDPLVKSRLEEMILLIRDRIVNDKGNLVLFFQPDWTPVSFRDSSHESILKHHSLDHVSWGHDIETAYLLLEATQAVGWKEDSVTRVLSKKMTDQCLKLGWDDTVGGFYDEGYYFKDKPGVTVTREDKVWWTQAEALNTLLLMADLYPLDPLNYYTKFKKQWSYIDQYLIDHQHGEWYDSGLDKDPKSADRFKGHIWKAGYHQYRSLENCVARLRGKD